ncbi:oxidoreductase [Acetobacter aceti NRIC 0242]|uniref:Oxidoreductase n=2 Tax=Acetobacter aceti TaxID=435 RepID=A0A6S6PG90_ACEAC|nr:MULTISPECIES: SDR family NAD(P)-dependent oxidoreductase [Acetobacter]GBO79649.1 oxidoreductase [Acetobacter aceti NRIC 0242]TCS34514.1 NADP-dependent 3-hydroxy acid dehydrogenase YdfG [Acetobacter aceti NBRC 14818]BCI65980.1 oxidoreductase [Acetobacter aceti]BCK76941.1 oxidoreductase [Acetobacter aceti NBRC 14818]GAN56382.1 oxidoreductase/short-chain dehydrogenase/reductase SDR [Acetobacter aceti NBRC 14818]
MSSQPYRNALVTGASSGIGAAIVRRLREAGLEVHAVARDEKRLAQLAEETGCIPHAVSVADQKGIEALIKDIEVDVLINNAGQSRTGNITKTTPEDIDALVDVNLRAVLQLTALVVPGMMQRDRGHIVNISSIAGHYAFAGGNTVYHATKAGVHSLSQQLRCDLFGHHIRVTEISPARVETEVFGRLIGDMAEAKKRFFDEYESLLPEDIANSVAFAVLAPSRMNVSFMEVLPTMQVVGGLNFAKKTADKV